MNINNVKGFMGYSRNSVMNGLSSKQINTKQLIENEDRINISKSARNISHAKGIGLYLDKGTAANTTLYVDRSTFNQITSYTTNNPNCKWDELGIDGEKRWIVVNGQRFECPLSEEEKEMRRRLAEEGNLIAVLSKAEKENKVHRRKSEKHNSVKLTFDENSKIKLEGLARFQSNGKIKNLMNNDKVMGMLSHIMKTNGGKAISFGF